MERPCGATGEAACGWRDLSEAVRSIVSSPLRHRLFGAPACLLACARQERMLRIEEEKEDSLEVLRHAVAARDVESLKEAVAHAKEVRADPPHEDM